MKRDRSLLPVKIDIDDTQMVTVRQAAKLCRCTERTVYNWIKLGRVKSWSQVVTTGGRTRVWVSKKDLVTPEAEQ